MDETFNPAALTRSDTITSTVSTTKNANNNSTTGNKTTKSSSSQSYPRIEFEPLYAELKSLIADNWYIYHDALTRFIRGELSSSEFGDLCDHFILTSPHTEHAHNSLICAVIHNVGRDSPEPGPAAFISLATDKATAQSASKPALLTSDASEQRLKAEIMALHARDRRRLKALTTDNGIEEAAHIRQTYEVSYNAARIETPPVNAAQGGAGGGITDKNWSLEIRKRYQQPLFQETMEFPDANAIQARILPICYQNGLTNGASAQCAELVLIATETYLKNKLHDILNRVRCNGPRYENSAGNGVFTSSYLRKMRREENELKLGKLQKERDDDMLPTEAKEAYARRPISLADIKLANQVGPTLWNGMKSIGMKVNESLWDAELPWNEKPKTMGHAPAVNGINGNGAHKVVEDDSDEESENDWDDDMELDDDDIGWDGATRADHTDLHGILGSILEGEA